MTDDLWSFMAELAEKNREIASLRAEISRLERELDASNKAHKATGELLAETGRERDALHGYVNGLLGLAQMVRRRDDCPDAIRDALNKNHRVLDAAAYLTQIVPPQEEA